jgi:small-conductance mechanosensitive channel
VTAGVVLALVVALVVVRVAYRRLVDRGVDPRRTGTASAAAGTVAVGGAAAAIVAVWGATDQVVATFVDLFGRQAGADALVSLLVVAAAYGASRVAARALRVAGDSASREGGVDHRREVASHVVQVGVYALAALVALAVWEVDVGNLLVGAGFLGVVVGLAARQTLGAVLAGFVLLFSRPFEVGDWVRLGDSEGVVTDVTVFTTQLRTADGEYVMIPNDRVTSETVTNRSREGRLRLSVEVGVDYDADPGEAAAVAQRAAAGVETVLADPEPRVVRRGFGDSAVVLEVRFWIDEPSAERKWAARTAVVDAVKAAFDREGIAIPFPQRTLDARDGAVPLAGGRAQSPATDGGDGSTGGEGS